MVAKIISTVLFIILASSSSYSSEITFLTHSVKGNSYLDSKGELRGIKHSGRRAFQIELIREMMMEVNVSSRLIETLPFKRALKMIIANRKQYALFNVIKRQDRLKIMKFVGPLTQDTTFFYDLSAEPSNLNNREEAKSMSICVLRGSAQITEAIKHGFTNIILNTYENCFKMLVNNRVRYAVISHLDLLGVLRNANIDPKQINNTMIPLYKSEGSISFSNQVPDKEVAKWQSALDTIKQSGRYDQLSEEYLRPATKKETPS
ncbi:MAG: transporter substrate-binding domain-containing protein [Sneathiella sp.]|nr:transporter substrate-binding domain-containing protein [Sneathiella sp.]